MNVLLLVSLVAAAFYLGDRALITSWLWSRYPRWLAAQRSCPACAGFWDTLGLAYLLGALDLALPYHPVLLAFSAVFWAPLAAGLMTHALAVAGSSQQGE